MGTMIERSDKAQLIDEILETHFAGDDLATRVAKRKELRDKSFEELERLNERGRPPGQSSFGDRHRYL